MAFMRIIFTRHALQRMNERGVTEAQVIDALEWPDEITPGDRNEEMALKRFGVRELRVVFEEIEPDTYLIYTVIKPKVERR
jgi:hypothetical protein